MTIQRFLLISILVMLVIGTSGCKLPASTPPASPTAAGGFPIPGEGTSEMGLFEQFATQTALATMGTGGEQEPVVPTDTPVPQEQQPTEEVVPVAPTPTTVVIPTATPGLPTTYTLQKGEFPYCIARRFNINPNELLSANNLSANSTTYPGLKLKIPQNARAFPGNRALHSHPTTYTVKANDTIYTIACYFGDVDPMDIALANGLKEPYKLTAGDSIQIP